MSIIKRVSDRLKYGCEYDKFEYLTIGEVKYSQNEKLRINLLIGTIDRSKMYGGLTTALNFYLSLIQAANCEARILVMNDEATQEQINNYPGFVLADAAEENSSSKIICDYSMHESTRPVLDIRENDIIIGTYWTTMYVGIMLSKNQRAHFQKSVPILYLIQDYEPGFFKWSSEYLLIDSTYHYPDTFAIFNSSNLANYFVVQGYKFAHQYFFEPRINATLKSRLLEKKGNKLPVRKKQIIVYGRPNVGRNCFSLLVDSLTKFSENYELANEWQYISIGGQHKDIPLANGCVLKCKGKLTLEAYADILLESKVGVSLMCSPHPSYPPLEMAAFGVNTVTNNFKCKDLSGFSDNILTIGNISIESLADRIKDAVEKEDGTIDMNMEYFDTSNQFDTLTSSIINDLNA